MKDTIDIDDPRAAAVFAHLRQRQIVMALVEKEHSLSQLAKITETPLSLLHHHIRKLRALKLVAITQQRARAGAPIKLYRATARAFFVPAKLIRTAPTATLNEKLRAALERSLAGAYKGILYTHDRNGARMQMVTDPASAGIATELWGEMQLSEADALALAAEFKRLLKRYESRRGNARHRYIVHAAIATR